MHVTEMTIEYILKLSDFRSNFAQKIHIIVILVFWGTYLYMGSMMKQIRREQKLQSWVSVGFL